MSSRYSRLPDSTEDDNDRELDAAFDDSDDDGEDATENQPLNPRSRSPPPRTPQGPGTYDFENVDYDYPPPGSPPAPSTTALPNNWGNSNGLIPSFDSQSLQRGPRRNWVARSAGAILPTHIAQRLGVRPAAPTGTVGGGTGNDGVFANVTAKPTAPVRVTDGDEVHIVPEDSRPEAPPSYSHAQADAVPPYWETTVHAPFQSGEAALGEMIVDALPTGSVLSFLWNLLVSVSFQFVGFLLTYLLHTTHAARLGARAGLGITLIQYGFALKTKPDNPYSDDTAWGWEQIPQTNATADSASDAPPLYHLTFNNQTLNEEQAAMLVAQSTTEWLSFFLMTVGWFVLLTSLLGFWRIKRWERGILASQTANSPPSSAQPAAAAGQDPPASQFSRLFGPGVTPGEIFRQGFGFNNRDSTLLARAEEGELTPNTGRDSEIHISPDSPQRARLIREAINNERRLQSDLRAAGLL